MLQQGLLWFDDDPARATADKVARAVQRYQQKYGRSPDVCYVHPRQLKEGELSLAGGVKVLPAPTVLPHHFWLGTLQPTESHTRATRPAAASSRSSRRRGG